MSNIQRLKFAQARGAKIELLRVSGVWSLIPRPKLNLPASSYRIHRDDAHLEYGPISTELREIALYDEGKFTTERDCAWAFLKAELPRNFIALNDDDADLASFLALFVAELLADEGL